MIATLTTTELRMAAASCGVNAAEYLRAHYGAARRRISAAAFCAPQHDREAAGREPTSGRAQSDGARRERFAASWRTGLAWYVSHRAAQAAADAASCGLAALPCAEPPAERVRVRDIVVLTAARYSIGAATLLSASRVIGVRQPRFEVCWRARRETHLSLPAIGRALGGRDHTTILHAARKYDEWRAARDAGEFARFPYVDWEKLL